ncbi:hypothetical protein BGZ76_000494 [Entomortierella beljakovae]|nr:hypothetical protein BGZ76_000494 [Entomortierella beljakovae]
MVECEVNNSFQGEEEDSTEASTTPSRTKVDSIETTVAEGDNDAQSKNVDIPQIVKRQQDNPFEINKKIRTFLDLGCVVE